MNEATMHQRVGAARIARLATVTAEGRPHVVPCCFALHRLVLRDEHEDVMYSAVDAKPKSTLALRRLDNLRANPFAALLIDHYAEDWSTLWWVRIDGRGRLVDGPERDEAMALLTAKYGQYRREPPPGPVVAIDALRWRGWP